MAWSAMADIMKGRAWQLRLDGARYLVLAAIQAAALDHEQAAFHVAQAKKCMDAAVWHEEQEEAARRRANVTTG